MTLIYRLLLVALLPIIGVVVYLDGQHYDPSLIRFQASTSTQDPMMSYFPGNVGQFTRVNPIRTFNKDTLYEYVNGHAEYFISAGFNGLAVAEYRSQGSKADSSDVVVDIYDMGKAIQAFSILSDEAEGSASLQAGDMELKTSQGISFIHGKYYIKIEAFTQNVPMDAFKQGILGQMGSGAQSFSEFSRFPDIGNVVKTRFIKESYRGLDFLNNVIEREYDLNGKKIQIALFAQDKTEVKKLTDVLLIFLQDSSIEFTTTEEMGNTVYNVKDRYEGDWALIARSDCLFGVYGAVDAEILNQIMKRLGS